MSKTLVFVVLTLVLIGLIIYKGVPFLVQMAGFFGDLKSSKELVESQDTTLPAPPRLQALPSATNSAQVSLKGFSEAGSTVQIILNNELEKEVIADSGGSFVAEAIFLANGKNRLQAIAIDQAGNKSQESPILTIDFDQEPPALEVNQPEPAEKVEITGKTEPEATLKINERLIILDQEGNFRHSLNLEQGENKILVQAIDPAGNQSEKEIILDYTP